MHWQNNIGWQNERFGLFSIALIIYALFGSPTADDPGLVEIIIGLCLLAAAGFSATPVFAVILFAWGITVPLMASALQGGDANLIFRDLMAFCFLCLPVFFYPLMKEDGREKTLILLALFVGLVFSARTLAPVYGWMAAPDELLYLANSPLVLFTAIYLSGYAGIFLYRGITVKNISAFAVCGALAVLPLSAMLVDVQRVGFAAVGLSLSILFVIGLIKKPLRMIAPIIVIVCLGFIFSTHLQDVITVIATKTAQVGLNMRLEEFKAVMDSVGGSPWTFLFGRGWGASFASPAVGGVEVNFTHSLLTYLFLKTGLIGCLLGAVYAGAGAIRVAGQGAGRPLWALARFWPLCIPVFLYASHKSLDFGVIMLLAFLPAVRRPL